MAVGCDVVSRGSCDSLFRRGGFVAVCHWPKEWGCDFIPFGFKGIEGFDVNLMIIKRSFFANGVINA